MTTGMIAAAMHAERVHPKWTDEALTFLLSYLEKNGDALAEIVVDAAAKSGTVPPPPDKRAWGAVFNSAARRGLITNAGFARAATSNNSFKAIWHKA